MSNATSEAYERSFFQWSIPGVDLENELAKSTNPEQRAFILYQYCHFKSESEKDAGRSGHDYMISMNAINSLFPDFIGKLPVEKLTKHFENFRANKNAKA